jgi:ribonuclease HII
MIKTNNIIGIDEAGRGPLIGRIYTGAVIWNSDLECDIIKDSKKMTPKRRAIALKWIESNLKFGIGYADHNEIDHINILNATKLAMDRAINDLVSKYNLELNNYEIYIDGCGWEKKFNTLNNVTSIIKGDDKYYTIAAGSIIAKEYHDKHIIELCKDNDYNDKYDLLKNKGYPTKKHIEGINKYGITIYHRKSFKRCNNI